MDALRIRQITPEDAEAASDLSAQLGYECDPTEMRTRIERLPLLPHRAVFVAELESTIAGWIDAALECHLQSEDAVVIGGLVVKAGHRGHGIGWRLCQAVEAWAHDINIKKIRVRSQIKRTEAHRFYLQRGYEQVKTSAVFEKPLIETLL
jgi:GNAT superfamily N-acetyltransferase